MPPRLCYNLTKDAVDYKLFKVFPEHEMQEFPFPMNRISDATAWTLPLHIGLILLAFAPFVFLFLQSRRKTTSRDGWLLMAALFLVPPALLLPTAEWPSSLRAFVVGYLIFFEVATTIALVVTVWRLIQQKEAGLIWGFLGALFLLAAAIGLLLPSVPAAREAARRMQCSNNLKQLALGMQNYEGAYGYFLPSSTAFEGEQPVSWRVKMLPFVENQSLYERYDRTVAWDHPDNAEIAANFWHPYLCPSQPFPQNEQGQYFTAYCLAIGPQATLQEHEPVRSAEIEAGLSNTLGVVEASGTKIVWTEPRDVVLSARSLGVNLPGDRPHTSRAILSSYHPHGAVASRLDGSVQFISEDIDPSVLARLAAGRPAAETNPAAP